MTTTHKIIAPDGADISLSSSNLHVIEVIGESMPPMYQDSYQLPGLHGEVLKSNLAKGRVLTLVVGASGSSDADTHKTISTLLGFLRPNRTPLGSPLIYEKTVDTKAARISGYLVSVAPVYRGPWYAGMTIRIFCPNPFVVSDNSSSKQLNFGDKIDIKSLFSRVESAWTNMGVFSIGAPGKIWSIDIDDEYIYVAGDFANINGIASTANIARQSILTGTWYAMGPGANGPIFKVMAAPDGCVYIGGNFSAPFRNTARWTGERWSQIRDGWGTVAPTDGWVRTMAMDARGDLWVGGSFVNLYGDVGLDYIFVVPADSNNYTKSTYGLNGAVFDVKVGPDGKTPYITGNFLTAGLTNLQGIAYLGDGPAWMPLGNGLGPVTPVGLTLLVEENGDIIVGGDFGTGLPANYIVRWDGSQWVALTSGLGADYVVTGLAKDWDGHLWVTGWFDKLDSLESLKGIGRWVGETFWPSPLWPESATPKVSCIAARHDNKMLVVGFEDGGNTNMWYPPSNLVNLQDSNAPVYPQVAFYNSAHWRGVRNADIGKEIAMDLVTYGREIAVLDLSPGVKSFTSNVRSNLLSYTLPSSNLSTLVLETPPLVPSYGNTIHISARQKYPHPYGYPEYNYTHMLRIGGVTLENTEGNGILYLHVHRPVAAWIFDLYKDAGKLTRVGYGTVPSAGWQPITPDGGSGVSGEIYVFQNNADMLVITIPLAYIRWKESTWDIHSLVRAT